MALRGILPTAKSDPDLLGIYLNDHLAGSAFGIGLSRRLVGGHKGTAAAQDLETVARQVAEDRDTLIEIMGRVGVSRRVSKRILAAVGERAARLKLNGRLVGRSPLSSVIELETMRLGVEGKASCWRTLSQLVESEPRLDRAQLEKLLERAGKQIAILERLHGRAVNEALHSDNES